MDVGRRRNVKPLLTFFHIKGCDEISNDIHWSENVRKDSGKLVKL